MHEFLLPMRWADLDSLNHVNNVVYVDYATQARRDLVSAGVLAADAPTGRVSVEYLRPLHLTRTPVSVRSVVDGDRLVQEIGLDGNDRVFARVTTTLATPEPGPEVVGQVAPFRFVLRSSDVGGDGTVAMAQLFELIQEARIDTFAKQFTGGYKGNFVVARLDVVPGAPLTLRDEPYEAASVVTHVGSKSYTMLTGLGEHGHAECVLVGFDVVSEQSREITDEERAFLTKTIS